MQRQLKDDVKKQRLMGAIFRQQLGDHENLGANTTSSVKSRLSTKSRQRSIANALQAPTPLTSRSIETTQEDYIRPADTCTYF